MRFIDKSTLPAPAVLTVKGAEKSKDDMALFNAGKISEISIDNKIYGHKNVKAALTSLQNGKCCFCESRIVDVGHGDIEHYRPKGGYKQISGEELHKPGYFWLAYDWNNLLLACKRCNGASNKGNLFPLKDPSKRAQHNGLSIADEEPLLINPSVMDPQEHISFHQEVAKGITPEGKVSVEVLGLNRLQESRLKVLNNLKMTENLYHLCIGSEKELDVEKHFKDQLANALAEEGVYTSMVRANFAKYIEMYNL